MEDIHQNQAEIIDALTKLFNNIKKDSSSRKVGDYFRRRLEVLENYWSDFQHNHNRLSAVEVKSHPYFVQNEYERAARLHKSIKALLCQEQELTEAGPSATPRSSDQQPTGKHQTDVQDKQASTRHSPIFSSRGTSSKTEEMLKKQSSNFRAFARTVANFHLDEVSEKWELEDALKTLEARWSVIDSLHWELDGELEDSNYQYEQSYTQHENTYSSLKKAINIKLWSVAHKVRSTPKMDIPIFAGSYQQWTSFKDLFTETIHNNYSIPNAQKMQYLKSKLRGEAERLIQHLPISSDNYNMCWDIINHRYNNIRLICSSHLDSLLNVPAIQQATVNNIKRLHDITVESLNAIKNLGIDVTSWDPLLLHLLSPKLDSETYNDYASSIKDPRAIPNIQEFLSFLEVKFTSMESSRKKHEHYSNKNAGFKQPKNVPYSNQPFTAQNQAVSQSLSRNSNSIKFKCMVCKNNDHGIYYCPQFLAMPPHMKRKTLVKFDICKNCLYCHNGQDCISNKRCRKCNNNHNTLLHEAFTQSSRPPVSNSARNATINDNVTQDTQPEVSQLTRGNSNASLSKNTMTEVLLPTAMIKVQAQDGTFKTLRALLDQGSQVCLISEHAAQMLELPRQKSSGIVCGIGEKESNCKGLMRLKCMSLNSDFQFIVEAFIMNRLVKKLPNNTFLKPAWSYLDNITLADSDFNLSRPIDILLSSSIYSKILLDGVCRATEDSASAQNTRLGWIISGDIVQSLQCNVVLNDLDELHKFWAIEDITESSNLSAQDQQCIDFYKQTTIRNSDGTYEVRLPFQENFENLLGSSKHRALAQFNYLERKFNNNEALAKQYKLFIQEYKTLGHMKLASDIKTREYYLPHHCVLRNDSTTTALRVVFNASSKTTTGYSLNDLMLKGPNLQQDLQSLLLKWRKYRIAFTADLEKMFRFIWLNEQDQTLQKIIWRDSPDMPHQVYQLQTVTYGTKAAPFLAMMTLKQLAQDEKHKFGSETIKALEQSFYMDDVLHGGYSLESALKLQKELIKLLKSGGFNLRKWSSNAPELRQACSEQEYIENFEFKEAESSKALGLRWNAKTDAFSFSLKIEPSTKLPTKRTMLSDISKLFDPLGWLSPLSTKLKLLFHQVWMSSIQWDEHLPENIYTEWVTIRNEMNKIDQFQVKRWLGTEENDHMELHGFCDSSNKAYACVVYCKQIVDGEVKFAIVAGKSRVVPASKTVSLPKLELCGALLLAKLISKIQDCLSSHTIRIYCWTDSMVVLAWLQGEPGRWKPFVANRVRQITNIIPAHSWRYIKSADNPADCASRGMTVDQLRSHSLWWEGPSWLQNFKTIENIDQPLFTTNEEARKTKQVNYITPQDNDVNILSELLPRYSSFTKLTRVLAWILRFIKKIKERHSNKQSFLTLQEIKCAKYMIIRYVQEQEFSDDIINLQQGKSISTKSSLLQFNRSQFLTGHAN